MSTIACSSERRRVGGFVRRHESGDCFTQPLAPHSPACTGASDSERMPGFPMPTRSVGQVRHAMRAIAAGMLHPLQPSHGALFLRVAAGPMPSWPKGGQTYLEEVI